MAGVLFLGELFHKCFGHISLYVFCCILYCQGMRSSSLTVCVCVRKHKVLFLLSARINPLFPEIQWQGTRQQMFPFTMICSGLRNRARKRERGRCVIVNWHTHQIWSLFQCQSSQKSISRLFKGFWVTGVMPPVAVTTERDDACFMIITIFKAHNTEKYQHQRRKENLKWDLNCFSQTAMRLFKEWKEHFFS